MTDLAFRAATEADVERILEIHFAAFPDSRVGEERKRGWTANPLGGIDRLVVAERRGTLVAHAFLYGLETYFGAVPVKTGAIASVGVAPEARRQGVGAALLGHLHALSDRAGDALTMLYAFRQGFYARLGYAVTTSRKRLEIDARAIPEAWARGVVRRARGEDKEAMLRVYERAAKRTSGWIVRPEALWTRRLARERRHHLVVEGEGGDLAGYVAFELLQDEPHAETRISVDEVVADDERSRQALWAALGAMCGQVSEIEIEVAADDPIELALLDLDGRRHGSADVEHPLGTIVGGPMVRIEDPTRAIEARGYAGEATFDVVVDDEIALSVHVEDGRAQTSAARGGSVVRTSRRGLASLLYGGVRLSDAVRLGVAVAEPRTVERVEPVLALPPLLPIDPF